MPDEIDADPSRTAEIETGRPKVVSSRVQSGGKGLCVPVSELIGREGELAEVTALVTKHRLVTLTGEGGIGKTHLAIEVARHLLSEFVDGAWVAELAPLADPELVPVTVATALGLELAAGAMSAERVANALGGKQLMLLLDNCEHVIDIWHPKSVLARLCHGNGVRSREAARSNRVSCDGNRILSSRGGSFRRAPFGSRQQ
jgi:hypothetical protein